MWFHQRGWGCHCDGAGLIGYTSPGAVCAAGVTELMAAYDPADAQHLFITESELQRLCCHRQKWVRFFKGDQALQGGVTIHGTGPRRGKTRTNMPKSGIINS
jgi:hypothetical protein